MILNDHQREVISEWRMLLDKGGGSIDQDENEALCWRRPASMCRAEGREEGRRREWKINVAMMPRV